jgi:hypothetical protein
VSVMAIIMRRQDRVPWGGKHPLLTCHTHRAPLAEITCRNTGLPVVKASMEICNRKQGHYSDRRICKMAILKELQHRFFVSSLPRFEEVFICKTCSCVSNKLGDIHTISR